MVLDLQVKSKKMKKRTKKELLKEILRVKSEIIMGDRNGHIMTKDYENKLKILEKELEEFKND
tara:strand:+ start:375 stop:563 length:189 start_codon:yes stop_codon:yes gene_type:complete